VRCKHCAFKVVIRWGKRDGKQRFRCKNCGHTFLDDDCLPRTRTKEDIIVTALDLYFDGLSVRKIQRFIAKNFGVRVSQVTIWKWVQRYVEIVKEYTNSLKVEVKGEIHADETVVSCKGVNTWYWDVIDTETRFILATYISRARRSEDAIKLFREARARMRNLPHRIVTDGLPAYIEGYKKNFWVRYKDERPEFIHEVGLRGKGGCDNNIIERFHGTIKDRLKPMRGLGRERRAKNILDGFIIHYNFIKPHESLEGRTPAEMAGIEGLNDWRTLIKQAIKHLALAKN
jgi:transposase-like protein